METQLNVAADHLDVQMLGCAILNRLQIDYMPWFRLKFDSAAHKCQIS